MNDLENYLLDEEPAELTIDGLLTASSFFLELKAPLTKEAMSFPKLKVKTPKMPKVNSASRDNVKNALKKAGVKTTKLKTPKMRVKVAFLSRLARGAAHSGQASGRAGKGTLAAVKAGLTDEGPRGIKKALSKLPSKRIKKWAGDPEELAKSKGEKYYRAWQEGRDIKRTVDPGGLAAALNKSVRNREGNITAGSLIQGLDDTGIAPTSALVGSGYAVGRGLKKARADRIASKKFNRNLAIGGGAAGLTGLALARKRAENNA
jgi:hypothetical protein